MSSQNILLTGGLLLFLLGVGYGLVYDGLIMPENHRAMVYSLDMALNMAAKGDLTMASAFAGQYGDESFSRDIGVRIPLHLALAGAMTTLPLWIAVELDISERMKRTLALFMVGGGLLMALGDFLRIGLRPAVGYYLVMAGYGWLFLGLAGYLLYAVLDIWLREDRRRQKRG
ncbi:MAG: hypothetical protein P4N59_33265 [Negativicutes bacterium]|nr:hypothetical protein [Negativicutes bacterium]